MKAKTKLFSLLLAVCLMLSVMPMAALADDEAPAAESPAAAEDTVAEAVVNEQIGETAEPAEENTEQPEEDGPAAETSEDSKTEETGTTVDEIPAADNEIVAVAESVNEDAVYSEAANEETGAIVSLSSLTVATNGTYDANTAHVAYTYDDTKKCNSTAQTSQVSWVKTVTLSGIAFNEIKDETDELKKLQAVIMNGRQTDQSDQFKDSIEVKFVNCTFNQTSAHLQVYKIMPCNVTKYTFENCTFNQEATGQYAITLNTTETAYDKRAISYEIINSTINSKGRGINITSGTTEEILGNNMPSVIISGNTFNLPATDDSNMAIQIAGVWDSANLTSTSNPLITVSGNTITAYTAVRVNDSMKDNTKDSAKYVVKFTDNVLLGDTRGAVTKSSDTNETTKMLAAYYNAQIDPVAEVNGTYYSTLQDAVNAAKDGETVKLLCDVEDGTGVIVSGDDARNITIDFAGHTYKVSSDPLAGSTGTKNQCFQLLKGSTITMKNGTVVANNSNVQLIIQNYSNLTLDGMTLDATVGTNSVKYVLSNNQGSITITGGTAITAKETGIAFDVCTGWGGYTDCSVTVDDATIKGNIEFSPETQNDINSLSLIITGGTVNGDIKLGSNAKVNEENGVQTIAISGGTFSSPVKEEYCAEGYEPVANKDGTYTVGKHELKKVDGVAATCNTAGTEAYWKCDTCGKMYSDDAGKTEISAPVTVKATGHSYGTEWKSDGTKHWHECTACGAKADEAEHTFSGWVEVTAATATETGTQQRRCKDCGYVESAEIPVVKIEERVEVNDLATVPEELKATEFNTVEAIEAELTRVAVQNTGYTAENTAFYDVKLQISTNGGATWIDATEENFPEGGIPVTLDYPTGTGKDTHDFVVTHMFAATSTKLNTKAGETETPAVTKTDKGIVVTLKGLSPVSISWKEIEKAPAPEESPAASDAPTATPAPTPKAPPTGDSANIGLWAALLAVCALGAAAALVYGRKRQSR